MFQSFVLKTSILFAISLIGISLLDNTIQTNAQPIEWKSYTNNKLNISFDYPSNWILGEKSNRFEDGADIYVEDPKNPINRFAVTNVNTQFEDRFLIDKDKDFNSKVNEIKNLLLFQGRIIEDLDFYRYSIDGKETGTLLLVINEGQIPVQSFFVNNGTNILSLVYQNTAGLFDSTASQDIMTHIINSFKFLPTKDT